MSNGLLQSTPINKYKQNEDKDYKMLMVMPNDFRKDDPERINMFCKRMKEIRKIRDKEALASYDGRKPVKNERLRRQKDLASILGVSVMTISKYESYDELRNNEENDEKKTQKVTNKTKIKSIPMKHIRRICSFYDVTPHYILGYVDNYNDVLVLDEAGKIQYQKKDGSENQLEVKVLKIGMSFLPSYEVECIEEYKNLSISDYEFYMLISKLILSKDEKIHKICKQFLSVLLDS